MRLRELAEDLRFALARLAKRAPGGPRGAARRLRRAWFGRSLAFRRRSVAVLAVLALYALLKLAGSGAPCDDTPSGECPPPDEAIALVPAGAYAYAHADLDAGAAQYAQGRALAGRLPDFGAIAQGVFRELGPGRKLDLAADVFPWLGDEAAIAALPGSGGSPQRLLLLAVDSERDARQLAARIAGAPRGSSRYRGVTVQERAGAGASAEADGFLLLGPAAAVHAAIDAQQGEAPSLNDDPSAVAMRADLPAERLADAYVSAGGVDRLLTGADSIEGPLDAVVDLDASQGVAAAAVAEDDGLALQLRSRREPAAVRRDPGLFAPLPRFAPDLAKAFPASTLALLAIGDRSGRVRKALGGAIPPALYNAYPGPGDRLVVSTSRRGEAEAIASQGDLAGSDAYRTVMADAPRSVSALVFLDLSGLVRLAATRGLTEIVSGFQADLAKLSALGVTVDADEDSLDTRLFLEIDE